MENPDSNSYLNSRLFSDASIGFDFQNNIFYILVSLIIAILAIFYYRNPDFLARAEIYINNLSENMEFYKNKLLLSINMDNGAVKSYSSL